MTWIAPTNKRLPLTCSHGVFEDGRFRPGPDRIDPDERVSAVGTRLRYSPANSDGHAGRQARPTRDSRGTTR